MSAYVPKSKFKEEDGPDITANKLNREFRRLARSNKAVATTPPTSITGAAISSGGGGGGTVPTTLEALSDVLISSPSSGDTIEYNGTKWINIPLTTTNVPEGTNLYYTDVRARLALSATTPILYNNATGALTFAGLALAALSDVSIGVPSNGDLLHYVLGTTKWTTFTPTYISGNQTITLSGNVTGSGATAITTTIAANAVALSMLAQQTAPIYLGRHTAGLGNIEAVTPANLKSDLSLVNGDVGLGLVENTALSTWSGTANVVTVGTIVTGTWNALFSAGIITLTAMANIANNTYLGNRSGGAAAPSAVTLANLKTDLSLTGTNSGDQTITLTGDITGSGVGSFATTLKNTGPGVGTYTSVTIDIQGRVTAGSNPGFLTTIAANYVTLAMLAQQTAPVYLGRHTAGLGNIEAVTPANLKSDLSLVKADVGLSLVENTALSTWAGTANITILGTIATGVWNAGAVTSSGAGSFTGLTVGTLAGVLKGTAGVVSGGATTSDVPEGTNLYFTNARAVSAVGISGSIANTQVAVGTGVNTLGGSANLTFDGSSMFRVSFTGVVGTEIGTQGPVVYSYGSTPLLFFRASSGTFASPGYPLAGGFLGIINAAGWDVSAGTWQRNARLNFKPAENWTATAQGTYTELLLTYLTTKTLATAWSVTPSSTTLDFQIPNGGLYLGDITVGLDPLSTGCTNLISATPTLANTQTSLVLVGRDKGATLSSIGQINFGHYNSGTWYRNAFINGETDSLVDAGRISLFTKPTGGALARRLIIDSVGDVTIGATAYTGTGSLYVGDVVSSGNFKNTGVGNNLITGLLRWYADNTYDIGSALVGRPRNLYLGSNFASGGTVTVTAPSSASTTALTITGTFTATGAVNASFMAPTMTVAPAGASGSNYIAMDATAYVTGGVAYSQTGPGAGVVGLRGTVTIHATGATPNSVSALTGMIYSDTGSPTVTNGYVVSARWAKAGTPNITNAYGVYIQNCTWAVTNNYGLYIEAISGGVTLNYAIYTNAGLVRFGGAFGCNAATPQTAAASGGALAAYVTGVFGLDTGAHMLALYNQVVAIRAALVANGIMS